MNKFIQSTKQFFNKKPVRIVVALLIIAAIMTGIAFGIMALIGAFKDPCQSGYHYDNNLKVCVKDGCKNICGTDRGDHQKGDCLSDDYCNYSISGIEYKFDKESCKCFGICSSDNEIAKTDNGDDSTIMEKTGSGWKPVNALHCGTACEFSKSGICIDSEAKCSVSIDNKGNLIGPKTGCIKKERNKTYVNCKTDRRISCQQSTNTGDLSYSCEEVSDGKDDISFNINGNTYTTRTYCKNLDKCGENLYRNYVQVCQKQDDCGVGGTCVYNNQKLITKGIYNIGVCTNTTDFLGPKENSSCVEPNKIGESKIKHPDNNLIYIAESGFEGISLNQPQCPDIVGNTPQCKSGKLDNWFCKGDYIDHCTYSSGQEYNISCPEEPPIPKSKEGIYNFNVNCCKSDHVSKLGSNGTFCCPGEVKQTGNYAYKCLNFSEHPPDQSWLGINPALPTKCDNDNDCSNFEQHLLSTLGGGAQNTISDEETYSGMFCDKSDTEKQGQCKFFAGYIDKTLGPKVIFDSKWIMGNDSSTSEAILKNASFNEWEMPELPLNNSSDFNMCTKDNITPPPSAIKFRDTNPLGYKAYLKVTKKTNPPTKLECLRYAKHLGNDSFYTSFVQEDGSIDTSSNIVNNSTKKDCTIVADCNSPSFGTTINNTSGDNLLNFDFEPKDIDKLSLGKDAPLNSANNNKNIYFAAKPVITNPDKETDCGSILYPADIDTCDKPVVPDEWSNYKHLFKSVCKKDGQQCNDDDSGLTKYILEYGKYCPNGVTLHNKNLECI